VQIGDLVQLLDVHGRPEQLTGVVMGFGKKKGSRVSVHWFGGVNIPDAYWGWGRLKVLAKSNDLREQ